MATYAFEINLEGNTVQGFKQLETEATNFKTKVAQVSRGINEDLGNSFDNIGSSLTKLVPVFVVLQGVRSFFKIGTEMEQTNIAFEVYLGNVEKAKQLVSELQQFAIVTPFTTKQVSDGARMLLNYGDAENQVMNDLKILGDASGGVYEKFERMTYGYAQVMAKGKLLAQDNRQLIDAGFNPLQEMARKTGKSLDYFTKMMENGQISAAMVRDAFTSATSEGGRFYHMMDRQSKTVGGLWSTFIDTVQFKTIKLFEELSPLFKGLISIFTLAINVLSPILNVIGKILSNILSFIPRIGNAISDAFGPKTSDMMEENRKKLNELVFSLNDVNKSETERKNILDEIRKLAPDIAKSLQKEGDQYTINANALREWNDQMLNKIVIQKRQEEIDKNAKKSQTFANNLDEQSAKLREKQVNIIDAIAKKAPELAKLSSQVVSGELFDSKDLKKYYEQNKSNKTVQWLKENQLLEGLNMGSQAQNLSSQSEFLSRISKHLGIDPEGIASGMKDYYDILEKVNEAQFNYNNFMQYGNTLTKEKNRIAKMLGIDLSKLTGNGGGGSGGGGITTNALNTSLLSGASGGLGEAKIIKIEFHAPLMKVDMPGGNGMDVVAKAPMTIEMMLRLINNLSQSQGSTM